MAKSSHFREARSPGTGFTRREALRSFATFVAASPLIGATSMLQGEPAHGVSSLTFGPAATRRNAPVPSARAPDLMSLVNLHDFEELAKQQLSIRTYDYIAAGSADDLTMKENRAAFGRVWIRRGVMRDASNVDTSVELLGQRLEHPVLLAPGGNLGLLQPDGRLLTARAARNRKTIHVGANADLMEELGRTGEAPAWWAMTLGHFTAEDAAAWATRSEDAGASALCLTVDYPYAASRDRPSRHGWERSWSSGVFGTPDGEVIFNAGMIDPYYPHTTWEWLEWARAGSRLPIVLKGIVTGADAHLALENGAQAIIVSNHGGRTIDGARGTLDALPEVVDAVSGRVPVLVDGGIRRGSDVLKALGLGATAILIARPYLWGLGTFGQEGVERVIELLSGEFHTALGLSGSPLASAIDGKLIRRAWEPRAGEMGP